MGAEEERRQDGVRLKAVEEAIIEFRVIAKTIVVDQSRRLDEHDKEIDDLKAAIYLSCDAKTTEFEGKTNKVKESLLKVIGGVAGLGLAAVIYFNLHVSAVESNIASIHTSIDNQEKQNSIILMKLDNLTTMVHTNKGDNK